MFNNSPSIYLGFVVLQIFLPLIFDFFSLVLIFLMPSCNFKEFFRSQLSIVNSSILNQRFYFGLIGYLSRLLRYPIRVRLTNKLENFVEKLCCFQCAILSLLLKILAIPLQWIRSYGCGLLNWNKNLQEWKLDFHIDLNLGSFLNSIFETFYLIRNCISKWSFQKKPLILHIKAHFMTFPNSKILFRRSNIWPTPQP